MPSTRDFALMSREAYEQAQFQSANVLHPDLAGKSWEIFHASLPAEMQESGFTAVVFVNPETKEAVVAFAGTDQLAGIDGWNGVDTDDDAAVAAGQIPQQFAVAQQYTQQVKELLAEQGYNLIGYTGHSLGAPLSDLKAVEDGVRSTTFDNPGSKPMVDTLADQLGIHYDSSQFSIFNSNPHLINTTNDQVGPVNQIAINNEDWSFSFHSAFQGIFGIAPPITESWYTLQAHQLDRAIDAMSETTGEPIILLPNIDQRQEEIHIDFDPRDVGAEDVKVSTPFDLTEQAISVVGEAANEVAAYFGFDTTPPSIEPPPMTDVQVQDTQTQPETPSLLEGKAGDEDVTPAAPTQSTPMFEEKSEVSESPVVEADFVPVTENPPFDPAEGTADRPEPISATDEIFLNDGAGQIVPESEVVESTFDSSGETSEIPGDLVFQAAESPVSEVSDSAVDFELSEPPPTDFASDTESVASNSAPSVQPMIESLGHDNPELFPANIEIVSVNGDSQPEALASFSDSPNPDTLLTSSEPTGFSPNEEVDFAATTPLPDHVEVTDLAPLEATESSISNDETFFGNSETIDSSSSIEAGLDGTVAPPVHVEVIDLAPLEANESGTEYFAESTANPSPDFSEPVIGENDSPMLDSLPDTGLFQELTDHESTPEFQPLLDFGPPSGFEPEMADPQDVTSPTNWATDTTTETPTPNLYPETPSVFDNTESVTQSLQSPPSVFESTETLSAPSLFNQTEPASDGFQSTPSIFETVEPIAVPDNFLQTDLGLDSFHSAPSVFETTEPVAVPDLFHSGDQSTTDLGQPSTFEPQPGALDVAQSPSFQDIPSIFDTHQASDSQLQPGWEVADPSVPGFYQTSPSVFDEHSHSEPNAFEGASHSAFDVPFVFGSSESGAAPSGLVDESYGASYGPSHDPVMYQPSPIDLESVFDATPTLSTDPVTFDFDHGNAFDPHPDLGTSLNDIPTIEGHTIDMPDLSVPTYESPDFSIPDMDFAGPSFDYSDYVSPSFEVPSYDSLSFDAGGFDGAPADSSVGYSDDSSSF